MDMAQHKGWRLSSKAAQPLRFSIVSSKNARHDINVLPQMSQDLLSVFRRVFKIDNLKFQLGPKRANLRP